MSIKFKQKTSVSAPASGHATIYVNATDNMKVKKSDNSEKTVVYSDDPLLHNRNQDTKMDEGGDNEVSAATIMNEILMSFDTKTEIYNEDFFKIASFKNYETKQEFEISGSMSGGVGTQAAKIKAIVNASVQTISLQNIEFTDLSEFGVIEETTLDQLNGYSSPDSRYSFAVSEGLTAKLSITDATLSLTHIVDYYAPTTASEIVIKRITEDSQGKISFSTLKAKLKSYFDTLYSPI